MGLLSGKYTADTQLSQQDVRGAGHDWIDNRFPDGRPDPTLLTTFTAIREILTTNGRTPVQGALAWHWALGDNTIPIPGFKGMQQAEENAKAMNFGPLTPEQVAEIDRLRTRAGAQPG
jgi:aryl-alcohol dehydrogenase-like predicted oxidoreductase